jgi:hypothetical protein
MIAREQFELLASIACIAGSIGIGAILAGVVWLVSRLKRIEGIEREAG